jgi:SAM-dependent methyltransferase
MLGLERPRQEMELRMDDLRDYFADKLETFGVTPRGVDWNSVQSQEVRFAQLVRIVQGEGAYSLIDYGSGFGGLYDFLKRLGHRPEYYGYDFLPAMVARGLELHPNDPACHFTTLEDELPQVDYVVASGIFNVRLQISDAAWTENILQVLSKMDRKSRKGFAFNMLTKYSDPEYIKPGLFYADPCLFFEHCKREYARNIALLHDYGLYDFTILVRKNGG